MRLRPPPVLSPEPPDAAARHAARPIIRRYLNLAQEEILMIRQLLEILLLVVFSMAALVPLSCKDSGEVYAPLPLQVITIDLRNTDTYHYPTTASGDEEGALVTKQALHYSVSEIRRNASTNFRCVYVYQPQEGFSGSDYAEIEIYMNSEGTVAGSRITLVGFRFIVTE